VNGRIRLVSVIDDLTFGGDEARLLAFALSIDRSRFEHIILTIQRGVSRNVSSNAMRHQYAFAGIEVRDLGVRNALEPSRWGLPAGVRSGLRIVAKSWRLWRALRTMDVDVVDAHLMTGGFIGALAALLRRIPSTVTIYNTASFLSDDLSRSRSSRFRGFAEQLINQLTFAFSTTVITDSDVRAADFRGWMWRKRPVVVIPNGLRPPASDRTRSEMRRALGLPADLDSTVFGQVSALVEYKGLMVLLDAAQRVLREEPCAALLIVGHLRHDETFKKRLELKTQDLGISDRVRIVSYPGPVGDVWKAIDIHVHASLFDSLPNAIIEGMSLALPAVVTAVGGVPSLVDHRETGLVVPPGDPVALAEGMLELLRCPEAAQAMGRAAYRRYCDRYRVEVMSRGLEKLFATLATTPPREHEYAS
jgi:L-malate glycosyltransferase